MPDTGIFSQGPPEWLQRRALLNEQASEDSLSNLAGILGSGIAAGIKTGEKGGNFLSHWHDAYEQISDPYYDIKRKTGELNLESTKAGLDQQNFTLNEQKGEVAAWQKDLPSMTKWMSLTPEKRLTEPTPVPSSNKGIDLMEKVEMNDSRVLQQKEALKIRNDNSKAQIAVASRITDWSNSYAQATPQAQASIAALGNDAYETDAMTGKKVPSLEAITILDQDRAANGLPPFGSTPAQVAAFSRERVAKQQAQARADLEKQKGQSKTAPQTVDIGDGVELAWMPGGKTVHVINKNGKNQQMTSTQMQSIAKGLLAINPDDTKGKAIMDFLSNKALQQTKASGKSPQEKADLANKTATDHPDWTREQIIDFVNKQ